MEPNNTTVAHKLKEAVQHFEQAYDDLVEENERLKELVRKLESRLDENELHHKYVSLLDTYNMAEIENKTLRDEIAKAKLANRPSRPVHEPTADTQRPIRRLAPRPFYVEFS
jgi:hypothetical protein